MTGLPADLAFGEAWIAAYFAEVDRMDPDGLLAFYDDAASFRFAGHPAIHGKPAIRETLTNFYASLHSMRHRMNGVWIDPVAQSGVWEAEVDFVTKAGHAVTIPAVSVLRLRDGRVHDFRFVMDAAPLWAAGQ